MKIEKTEIPYLVFLGGDFGRHLELFIIENLNHRVSLCFSKI